MPKQLIIILFTLIQTSFQTFGQTEMYNPATKFIEFLNNYQTDSLETILADNFRVIRSYNSVTHDKISFLNRYVPSSKNFDGKYIILSISITKDTTLFLVKDQSNYLKYLHIDYPNWKIKLITNEEDQISKMIIDTTESYQNYIKQIKVKGDLFENWLSKKYPAETIDSIYSTESLLLKRLKEFSEIGQN